MELHENRDIYTDAKRKYKTACKRQNKILLTSHSRNPWNELLPSPHREATDTYVKREDKASCCKPNDYLTVLRDGKELAITYTRRPVFSDYMFAHSP